MQDENTIAALLSSVQDKVDGEDAIAARALQERESHTDYNRCTVNSIRLALSMYGGPIAHRRFRGERMDSDRDLITAPLLMKDVRDSLAHDPTACVIMTAHRVFTVYGEQLCGADTVNLICCYGSAGGDTKAQSWCGHKLCVNPLHMEWVERATYSVTMGRAISAHRAYLKGLYT